MAVHINMAVREHEERRVSLERGQLDGYTEATGLRTVQKYTGPWAAMLERAQELAAASATKEALSLELERQGGDIGELTVTSTEYRQVVDGDGEAELGTEGNPVYTCSFSTVAVPLLTHPKFAGISTEDAQLIKELENGLSLQAVVLYKGVYRPLKKALDMLDGVALVAAKYYYKGVTQYYAVQCEATARWRGGGNVFSVGQICTPPGHVLNTPSGCNWLCTALGKEDNGEDVWNTATFLMSAPGGWDDFLYGS